MSGAGKPGRHLGLPGVRIVRLSSLAAPEYDEITTPTEVIRGVDRPPEPLRLRVSTPLQTVFECLSKTRTYRERALPDAALLELIADLPAADRERAERFAARNGLRREYLRFRELSFGLSAAARLDVAEPDAADIHFYGWRVGTLTYLGAGEYRFAYDPEWKVPLSPELPLRPGRAGEISYEGRRMPAFFENCLPEGWTESVVLASNKLSKEDLFGLFSTTRKYLSNLTLRPLGIPEAELVYDAHVLHLRDLAPEADGAVLLEEEIGDDPGDPTLWRRTRGDGPLRLSGVQAKLPVSLFADDHGPRVRIGDLRHACTHILKVPSAEHAGLVENEWATMELARRIGLPTAGVARVRFQEGSRYRGRSLLVERYDIPERAALERGGSDTPLILQEDACSLLLLRREHKYKTSLERVASALVEAGLSGEDMRRFLRLVMFSWIVGNGDLHAKNVSILRRFRIGRPGEAPVAEGAALAPFYDLVNTRLHIPGDAFALPVGGKQDNIRLRDLLLLGSRWGMGRDEVRSEADQLAGGVATHLAPVLAESGLTSEQRARYRDIVTENLRTLGN
jgi:serine/threonine-protein kinase HipA